MGIVEKDDKFSVGHLILPVGHSGGDVQKGVGYVGVEQWTVVRDGDGNFGIWMVIKATIGMNGITKGQYVEE